MQRLSLPLPQPGERCRIQWWGWVLDNSQRPPKVQGTRYFCFPLENSLLFVLLPPTMFSDSHSCPLSRQEIHFLRLHPMNACGGNVKRLCVRAHARVRVRTHSHVCLQRCRLIRMVCVSVCKCLWVSAHSGVLVYVHVLVCAHTPGFAWP